MVMYATLHGVLVPLTSNTFRDCCAAIRKHLKPFIIKKQMLNSFRKMLGKFEASKGISYIIGAVDGSHIPILVPPIVSTLYYYQKVNILHCFEEL